FKSAGASGNLPVNLQNVYEIFPAYYDPMLINPRFDRQLRIEGWNQTALAEARVGVVGDLDLLASLYVLAAAALGLNHLLVLAPRLEERLLGLARRLNPELNLAFIEGFYTHPLMADLFHRCRVIVDLSRYGLANKLLLNEGRRRNLAIIRGFYLEEAGELGFKVFTYMRGREWEELEEIIAPRNLPHTPPDDGVLDLIIVGLTLEETKNVLMGRPVTPDLITYRRPRAAPPGIQPRIGVVGAGALGNFVGLGLAYAGFQRLTFIDSDVVEVTNLNRQVFFSEAVGRSKAAILAERLNDLFGLDCQSWVAAFDKDTDISSFEVLFDCVDNFETRLALSAACQGQAKILISGGSSVDAGQVVAYSPAIGGPTPAELLRLPELAARRPGPLSRAEREACVYQPDPSVIMTNQVIAGFMVESFRRLLAGQIPPPIFYDATRDRKF
ncbi:MAG TPA: ThiF family adenylyltransferase, partial [Desulfobaccales bacterium]|nr:ThiF family adenylyltransferase [Desulfobaccales bacterium]